MGNVFSNSFGGSADNTPTTNWFWGNNQPTQGFGAQQVTAPSLASTWDSGVLQNIWNGGTPVREFGIAQSYNAMNSPSGSLAYGVPLGSNPYQRPSVDWWSMDGAFGNGQTGGWAMPAIQGLQAMFNWTQGNKALDLARDQFNFSKKITQKNLDNQTSLLNTAMQDRQNARRSASSSYQDTGSYMKEHGL